MPDTLPSPAPDPVVTRTPSRVPLRDAPVRPEGDMPEVFEAPPPVMADKPRGQARVVARRIEVWKQIDDLVVRGELTGEEARVLRSITQRTFADVDGLLARRAAGEMGPVGVLVRSIPVRMRHAAAVVDQLGFARAREVREVWRSRE